MSAFVRAVLVDPVARSVVAVSVPSGDLDSWYRMLGCDTLDMRTLLRPSAKHAGMMLAIDDVGLMKPNACFEVLGYAHPLAGRALFFGCDENGETVDCPVAAEVLAGGIAWRQHQDAVAQVRTAMALTAAEARARGFEVTSSPDGLCNVISGPGVLDGLR